MASYTVHLETTASLTSTVEADSPEEAIEAALLTTPSSPCAQCSGWGQSWELDLGEWDVAQEDGKDADWAVEVPDA